MGNFDLFFQRSVIGAWLEEYLEEHEISKTQFCKDCGLSRPTLDKILSGLITSETTFSKHMSKILNHLKMSPDNFNKLISRGHNNDMNSIRSAFKIDLKTMSEVTGIPVARLKKIESGKETFTQKELTDCAFTCNVDQNVILGRYIFDFQTDLPDISVRNIELNGHPSGIWGCLCIKSSDLEKDLKYWITDHAMIRVRNDCRNKFMVIPCLNNKLLLINTDNIDELRLMDFDGDYYEGEPDEFEGAVLPPQLFRALDDYFYGMDRGNQDLSEKARAVCEEVIKKYNISSDDVVAMSKYINVYYRDKKSSSRYLEDSDDLFNDVEFIYNFEMDDLDHKFIEIEDADGSYDLININNVVCIEMPLNLVEDEILKIWDEADREE